jgi:hypothetical protein
MQQDNQSFRETAGGMQMVTPSTSLRIKNGKLEQLCTVQIMGNNGPPGAAWSEWVPVPEVKE